jgi:zinc-ribbon domain
MGDPEFRSDESVILRTNGIFVKSIPFEGILTNKRIILVDRAKNLLPQKEIPLVTIKDIEVGENAIRDQIITLSILSKTGETRQMILTFSRQTGGNRIRERNEWAKALKEHTSSSFEQVIRKVVPGRGVALKKPERTVQPRVEVSSPVTPPAPSAIKGSPKKETERRPPVKNVETPSSMNIRSDAPVSGFGTYCSRCGNRVPEGSGFCNRCGSPIVVPGSVRAVETSEKVPPPLKKEPAAEPVPQTTPLSPPTGLSADRSPAGIYSDSLQEASGQQETPPRAPESFAPEPEAVDQEPNSNVIPVDEEQEWTASDITSSQVSESISLDREIPPPRNPRSKVRPGKRTVYAGIVIFLIVAVILGGFFIYPLISKGGQVPATTSTSPTTMPVTQIPSGNIVTAKVTPVITVPPEGIYVHIKYIGGWKGSYGIPSDLLTITNSGDRYYPVENATGIVQASFGKLDSSTKQTLLVEILRNGQVLTSGNTTAGFGMVTLSVDTVTGVAKAPEISSGGVAGPVTKTQTNQT